ARTGCDESSAWWKAPMISILTDHLIDVSIDLATCPNSGEPSMCRPIHSRESSETIRVSSHAHPISQSPQYSYIFPHHFAHIQGGLERCPGFIVRWVCR